MLMNETATATGGQAFYNTNGMKEITSRISVSDGSFYTLTYSPHDFHFDNKWHKVRVALNVMGISSVIAADTLPMGVPEAPNSYSRRPGREPACCRAARRSSCRRRGVCRSSFR